MEAIQLQTIQRKPSQQMRAVLTVLEADSYFMEMVKPWIDFERETIHWDPIFKFPWSSGHRAAALFIYSIWTDELRPKSNPFDSALSLNPRLQKAVLQALAIRWGLLELDQHNTKSNR